MRCRCRGLRAFGGVRRLLTALTTATVAATASPAASEVVRIVIDHREVILDGRAFGDAGAYERLVGRILFAFDPDDPANAAIVDLELAPRNADGRVEIWTDFVVLQPVDPQKRRDLAWFDLGEDGHGRSTTLLGQALLLRQGLTLVQVGWESSPAVPDGLRLRVPVAREADGAPVTGWVRREWSVAADVDELPLRGDGRVPFPVVMPQAPVHVLTVRDARGAAPDTVPFDRWHFVGIGESDREVPEAVALDGGFQGGHLYELVYRAQDPRVEGLGLAVVRDVMSYARYDLRSEFPTNHGVAFGVGGGGRFLRQFLLDGFNVDEGGRPVFDGFWIHGAGAGRGDFNRRFAEPARFATPTVLFPFTLNAQFDPVTGLDAGLLDRLPEESAPHTLLTHTGYDYWSAGAALTHTSIDGFRDMVPIGRHRAYHLASTRPRSDDEDEPGPALRFTLRALAVTFVDWVVDGVEPPASSVPGVGTGSLVPSSGVAYPAARGLPAPPRVHLVYRPDYGQRFVSDGIVDREPPILGPAFPAQVPQVDGVGNELGGVRGLDVRVPLATYLPWGERENGGPRTLALPLTAEEAAAEDDHRPSLQQLYGSEAGFLARVRAAAAALVDEGFLLDEDREAAIAEARERWLRLTSR